MPRNLPTSCSLRNLCFLLSHIAHFNESIMPPFFAFTTWFFYFLYFFYTSNNKIALFYKYVNITTIFICHYFNSGPIIVILPILLPNNFFASWYLINHDFYYCKPHNLIKALFFRVLSSQLLGFYFLYFFCTLNPTIRLFYK